MKLASNISAEDTIEFCDSTDELVAVSDFTHVKKSDEN